MIGDKDLDKVCKLAKIEISDDNRDEFLNKLNSIFDWINQLREIDVSSIDDSGLLAENSDFLERSDDRSLTGSRETLMKNTKFQKFGMFCVPKVVD
ncbi:MAG: Asp-tRNA(Asn)/Glu-tRNA(Gln) amidotransferase subunit GatC [Holosporales bacterium]|nr:Asp-tRNA(Asn)/Glu-tRNA(Gln) amidotransferase subunit GatC [Holosporales bacterium]